ncbi:ABC transporter substrate-binding protein [Tissierella sp. MB52-C2]|uniref:ABC transporter substrate-binding protein n=1 Tax=Tissierella sp. MB52-C2 TaxID=3070999 RepID=UPI00280AB4C7|nr:ABC transporter substrate-binding protein [Tissierella sp. MB52-C2]WMM25367.1 ABC transporter substrate-binding protein [Tissierella sp. MB52-C2]
MGQRKIRFITLTLAILILAGVLAGCGSRGKDIGEDDTQVSETLGEKELSKIKVAYNPGTGNILGFIAIDKGIAAEEGIEMELVPFSNSTDALTALQSKKIDMAVSFGTAAPLTYVTNGADFTIFGGYLSGGMPVYAVSDLEYKGLESFVGKKVATARMYTPDIVWRGAMKEAGYDLENDVTILEFKKPSEVLEAVKSGNADIGIGTNSTYLQSLEAGLKTIAWSNEFWDPVHVCCRPVANTTWINENRDTVKAFLRSYIRAEKVLNEDPEYAVKLNMEYLELDEENARTMLLETNQVFDTDPKSNGIRYMWNRLIDMEYIDPADIDVNDHINIEIYKEALDELTAENPEESFYKELQDKFVNYNSEALD